MLAGLLITKEGKRGSLDLKGDEIIMLPAGTQPEHRITR